MKENYLMGPNCVEASRELASGNGREKKCLRQTKREGSGAMSAQWNMDARGGSWPGNVTGESWPRMQSIAAVCAPTFHFFNFSRKNTKF